MSSPELLLPTNYVARATELAKTATDAYKELIAKLITEQTDDSPLRFQMDPNL